MPNLPASETVDPEASTSIDSTNPPIIYRGTNSEDAATFRASTDYPRFQQQYERAIDHIIQFVDQHDSDAERKTGIKNRFTELKAYIFSQDISDHSRHMYYQAKADMETISNLLVENKNPSENTLLLLLDLSEDTAVSTTYSPHKICAEGAKTQITLAANTLSLPTLDLFAQVQNVKKLIIQTVLGKYVTINWREMNLPPQVTLEGNHIHAVNAYMDKFSQELSIPLSGDPLAKQHPYIIAGSDGVCRQALMTALTPWQVTTVLAEKGLKRLKEQIGVLPLDTATIEIEKNLARIYGDIRMDAFLSYDESSISVQQDPTQLQLEIARKLGARQRPIEPMQVDSWLDWSIQEVKEADANGNRVLRIGDLFWKEDKYKIISQPDVSDLQTDYINQIAPEQLMRIIEQADGQHAAILGQINPQRLQPTSTEKIALFFSKLGVDEGINYATRHFDWFMKLDSNPLLPLLLTLPDDKIDAINPDLLRKMPTPELSAFFKQRNNNPSATYIERYTGLLNKHQDVTADSTDDNIFSTIKLKHLAPKIIINHILAKPDNDRMSHANKFGKLLIFAMNIGDQNMAKLLLQQSDIDLKQAQYGHRENPLYLALRKDQFELANLLLEKHALKDYQDPGLYNLLYYPIKHKNLALLSLLLEKGADPNRKSISDTTILSEAVLSGKLSLVTTLLRYQATDDEEQALQHAIDQGNADMIQAINGITYPILINRFDKVISSTVLRRNAAVTGKPIGQSYTDILTSLDKLHQTSFAEQIATAFTLKHQIYSYIKKHPDSGRNSAFEALNKQIDEALFAPDTRMEPIRQQIIDMAKKQPALAADFYQTVLSKPQDDRQIFADFMQKGINPDVYFLPVKSVAETAANENRLRFEATFQVDLAAQFNDFKIALSQARIDGSETAKFFLDEANKRVYLGYNFKELINLDPNIVGLLRRALQVEYATNNSFEEALLDECVNKTYLRKEQKARLAQLETTYNAIYHTDIAAWEKQYAGQALVALNQRLGQSATIGDQLVTLLRQRKGLLINNVVERNINRSPDGQRFIVAYMDSLKALGVTTIGLPLHQDLQPLIDAYQTTGTMSDKLQEEIQKRSLTSLFDKARVINLKIVALNIDNDGTLYQIGMANNAIVKTLTSLPQGEKFVAICDEAHLKSQPGTGGRFLPGVNRLMQLPTVKIGSNDNLTVLADAPPAQNFSPLGSDKLYPSIPKPPTKENNPSQRSYFEKRFLSQVSELFMSQHKKLDNLLHARIQMKQLRSHRVLVQGRASPEETFELHIGENNRYSIKNRADANDIQTPDGTYLFVNRVDEPGTVRLIKLHAEIQSPLPVGHTSMTQNEHDQGYDPVDVYYAGEVVFKQGILEKWTNGSGHYQPDEAQAKTNILPVVQRLLPLEKFETGWARYYEMLGAPLPVSNESVYQWDKPDFKKKTVISKPHRFDSQIILQLENDPTVMAAAGALFNKHPNHSVLVQLDMQGDYRVIYGDAKELQGNVRWQLVGHGRDGINNQNNQTFGGRSATELPRQIKQLSAALGIDYGINSKPNYISLVGCSLIDPEKQTGYAPQLLSSLNEQGIRADLSVRRTWLTVNEQGQKLTKDTDGQWQRKISEDKLILSWNKQGELLPATDLTIRLSRAMTITDELALGKITLPSLDATSRRELAEVFQLADGSLDERKLTLTTLDKTSYLAWRNDINQLQQLSDIHPQLNSLSGQEALQQSKQWNERQAASIGAWQAVGIKNSQPEVEIQTRIAPQGLYIGNNSLNAGADAMAQGLAWLNARASGEAPSHRFLSALVTYALINEQKANGVLSERDATQIREFRQRFDALKQATSISDKTVFSAQTDSPFNNSDGNYLLKTAHHALMLSSRTEQEKPVYYLYDPNVGEMRFSGSDGVKNRNALQTALHHYLADKDNPTETQTRAQQYGIELKEGQYQFDVYKVDISKAKDKSPALDNLQQLVGDFRSEAQRLATAADVQLGNIRLPARVLSEMGAFVEGKPLAATHLSQTNLVSTLRFDAESLSRYLLTVDNTDPSAQKAIQLLKQQIMTVGKANKRDLLIAHGNAEMVTTAVDLLGKINHHVTAGDNTQIKATLWPSLQQFTPAGRWNRLNQFSHMGNSMMQAYGYIDSIHNLFNYAQILARDDITEQQKKELLWQSKLAVASFTSNIGVDITQSGLGKLGKKLAKMAMPGSRMGQIGFKAGIKLAKLGGPLLSIAAGGFDIYDSYRSFSALSSTTDPGAKKDLIFSGTLSLVNFAVSVGTAIGLALGGTFAGPLGLGLSFVLVGAGKIYSAVRTVEEIEKYITLSAQQRLRSGWRAFWGLEQDAEIDNPVAYQQTLEYMRSRYHQQLAESASELLLARSEIDTLYYSRGKIVLKEHPYKRLKGQQIENTKSSQYHSDIRWSANEILQDKIKPEKADDIFYDYSQKKYKGENKYKNMSLEDSDYAFYTVMKIEGIDDNVNISSHSEHVIKQPQVTGQRELVGRFSDQGNNTLIKDLNVFQRDYHTVMGDFNGDGYKDIGYFSSNGFYLLSADGKGGYGQPQLIDGIQSLYYSINGNIANKLRLVNDINNDGRDDIIVITELNNNSLLNISLAQEEGGFTTSTQSLSYKLPDLSEPPSVLADIDGDGCADLVSWDRYNIRINYGGREGQFSTSAPIPLLPLHQINEPHRYIHHIAGDINGDGHADLISFTQNGEFYTLLGSANRQQPFTALAKQKNKYAASVFSFVDVNTGRFSFNTAQLQLKDMNADGYADLVVIKQDGHYSIADGNEDGIFDLEQKGDWGSEEENGSLVRYRPNILALYGQQQILGISIGTDSKNTLLSLNPAGEVNAHTFEPTRFQDTLVMFRLGEGNDTAIGQPGRRNFFEVDEGTKNFIGERYADSFLLMGKAAPNVPSILDGGEDTSSTTLLNDNDVVIAAAKPDDGSGFEINLTTGEARYWRDGAIVAKAIAKLRNIEHAQGHSETDDYLVGNEGNNQLNGMGGQDILFGEGGDDFLTLQAGIAAGGSGKDNYHILQNNRDKNVSVIVKETQGTQEISNILLDYKAEQIISLTLENNDVLITLNNDNNTRTTLKLRDLYPSPSGDNERRPQHNYLLYTRDGLMIADWLPTLFQNTAGNWPFTPLLKAQYHPDWDRNWQQHTQGKKLADIVIHFQQQNKQISFNNSTNSTIVLPQFMQLIIADTQFNDRLEGDDKNNLLRSTQGKDILVGKGGSDHYVIDAGKTGREVIIDNYDAVSPLDNLAQDILLLPLPVEQIRLQQKGEGILLSHHDAPDLHPKVRIRNFMKGERYRHLLLMDKNGRFHGLTVNPQGGAILLRDQVTQGDDRIVLYSTVLTNNSLYALEGDDVVIDKSGSNHTLYGGEGNDILLVEAGNNHLSGDAGNDTLYGGTGRDILLGGTGDDSLSGGDGDDSYLFARGDGIDLIKESGGQDSIRFTSNEISKKEVGVMRKWNDLHILVRKEEQTDNHIIVQGYYADSKNRIETIQAGTERLTGSNIDQLAEAMGGFLSQEGIPSLSHLRVQTEINRLWITTPAT